MFWSYKFISKSWFKNDKFTLTNADLNEISRKSQVWKNLKPYIKMDIKIIKFDDTEIEEYKFHQQ